MATTDSLTITRILTAAAERQASDIHLAVGNQPVLRRNGKLESITEEQVLTPEVLLEFVEFFLPQDKQALYAQQRHVTVGYNLGNRARFRVHGSFQKGYPTFDLRYIPLQVPPVTNLGLPKRFTDFIGMEEGLVLISGTLGSGRTTTMAALLDAINHTQGRHIVTLEDPIEYLFVNDKSIIDQRDIGDDVPNVTDAIQDLRHEDVDVLGVDVPVPPSAWPELLRLAQAGALVFVVMKADATVHALEYLASSWPGVEAESVRALLASSLLVASCQRLLPRVGGSRVPAVELLLGTPAVKSLIREGKVVQLQSVLETSRADGMIALERSLANLVKTNEVLAEEALAQAVNREALESMLKGNK